MTLREAITIIEGLKDYPQSQLLNILYIVVLLFSFVPPILELIKYLSHRRIRALSRVFWINKLVTVDINVKEALLTFRKFEFPESSIKGFIKSYGLLYSGIYIGIITFSYSWLVFHILLIIYSVGFFIIIQILHREFVKLQNSKISDDLIKRLQVISDGNLVSRYFIYGNLFLLIIYVAGFISGYVIGYVTALQEYEKMSVSNLILTLIFNLKYFLVIEIVILTLLIKGTYDSRKLQKNILEYLIDILNKKYIRKVELVIFTNLIPKGISGKLIDIFDKEVIKLENEDGKMFLIPWDSINFIAISSNKSQKIDVNTETND